MLFVRSLARSFAHCYIYFSVFCFCHVKTTSNFIMHSIYLYLYLFVRWVSSLFLIVCVQCTLHMLYLIAFIFHIGCLFIVNYTLCLYLFLAVVAFIVHIKFRSCCVFFLARSLARSYAAIWMHQDNVTAAKANSNKIRMNRILRLFETNVTTSLTKWLRPFKMGIKKWCVLVFVLEFS